jgi:6-phosphogluconate dehydrogenase
MVKNEVYLLVGLGKIGTAVAKNLSKKGHTVFGFDSSPQAIQAFDALAIENTSTLNKFSDLLASTAGTKFVLICIPEGQGLDELIDDLVMSLNENDVVIDLGNSHFESSISRHMKFNKHNIRFCDLGVSGGPSMAEYQPSLMCGSDEMSWPYAAKLISHLTEKPRDLVKQFHIGVPGSGHFVKMFHNAIEYTVMQMIGEACVIASEFLNSSEWCQFDSEIQNSLAGGYLADMTFRHVSFEREILFAGDKGQRVKVSHNGTGVWAAIYAYQNNISFPSLNRALEHRLSSLGHPVSFENSDLGIERCHHLDPSQQKMSIDSIVESLEVAFLSVFIQGFRCLDAFFVSNNEHLPYSRVLGAWQEASVLRGNLIDFLQLECERCDSKSKLEFKPKIIDCIEVRARSVDDWKRKITLSASYAPVMKSAINFLAEHPNSQKVSKILAAQRLQFGGHVV